MKYRILINIIVGLFIIGFLTTSCATYKRCSEKFQWKSDTVKTVIYRDTTIQVLIHGTDTVFATAYIQDTLYFQSGTAHSIVYVKHDTITQQLWSTDTIIKVQLDSALKVITIKDTQLVVKTEEGKGLKFMNKILWSLVAILGIVAIIVIIPRFFKKK
jgi:hypothetical protein